MAPTSIEEPVDHPPIAQEPSSTPIDAGNFTNENENENDPPPTSRNEEKEVSVGEILYGVESFHAIVQPGKFESAHKEVLTYRRSCQRRTVMHPI
jgi:hypothetical protein